MFHTWSGFCQKDHFYGKGHMPVIFALNICWKIQNEQVWFRYHVNYLLISFAWVTIWNMVSQSFCTDLELPQGHVFVSFIWLIFQFIMNDTFIFVCERKVGENWMMLKGNGFYWKWLQKSHLCMDIVNVYVDSWSLVLIDASWWITKLEEQRTHINRSLDETQKWRKWGPRSPLFCIEMTVNLTQSSTNLDHPL